MSQTLIIDSRDKSLQYTSNSSFRLTLNPAIENVHSMRLLFADIPAPDVPESYFLITVQEFGIHCRSSDINRPQSTFVVPLLSAGGSRSLFAEGSTYRQIAGGAGVSLSNLNITLSNRDGIAPDVGDWTIVVELGVH